MSIALWAMVGLFAAVLINRAADCWLNPARLACGLTRRPIRQWTLIMLLPSLYAFLDWRIPDPAAACAFIAVLILLAVIDLEQRRVPNAVLWPALLLAFVYAGQGGQLLQAVAAAGLALALFLAFYGLGRRLIGPGALGWGDVKLAMLIGAMIGLRWMPYALLLGVLLAGAAAAVLLLTGRARRGDSLAYGCWLALAAVVVLTSLR
jgi:leader peptidase (prepilin peptidase)/N-methyltransferase